MTCWVSRYSRQRRVEVVIPPDRQLAQGDLEGGRRLGEQVGADFGGPSCMRSTCHSFCHERFEDRLDRLAGKAPVHRQLQQRKRGRIRSGRETPEGWTAACCEQIAHEPCRPRSPYA
jgi:hypothetical protein